eukprot:scaffold313480_cov37-Tisochrysis_lutea.AAC.1
MRAIVLLLALLDAAVYARSVGAIRPTGLHTPALSLCRALQLRGGEKESPARAPPSLTAEEGAICCHTHVSPIHLARQALASSS